jgi:hypothetical protein
MSQFKFLYPKSWSLRPIPAPSPSISAVEIKIKSETDTIAYLRVHSDSSIPAGDDGKEKIKQQLTEHLAGVGVPTSNLQPIAPPAEKRGMMRFAGTGPLPEGEGLVAAAMQPAKIGWLVVLLVSPGRNMNPLAWLRAKRAFEIVTASLSTV